MTLRAAEPDDRWRYSVVALSQGSPGSTEAVGVPDRANALTLGHRKMMSRDATPVRWASTC